LRPGGRTEGAELCCSAQSVLADYKDMLMQIFRYYAAGEKVSCMAAAALLLKGGSSGPSASAGCMGRVGAAQDRIAECGHAAAAAAVAVRHEQVISSDATLDEKSAATINLDEFMGMLRDGKLIDSRLTVRHVGQPTTVRPFLGRSAVEASLTVADAAHGLSVDRLVLP
jgi:hypothetical protein